MSTEKIIAANILVFFSSYIEYIAFVSRHDI